MNKLFHPGIQITILVVLIVGKPAIAQLSSTYVFLKPIYAFPGNVSKLSETEITEQGITYTRGVYGSYGRGLCLQAGVGKMISSNFGFELAGEWVHGHRLKSELSSDDNTELRAEGNERIKSALIKPMLVLRNSGDLLAIYSKLGLAVAVYNRRYADASVFLTSGTDDIQINTTEINIIKPKVGFAAAFGLSFRISQSMAVSTELSGQMISLPPKNGRYTSYRLNGRDILSTLPANQRTWVYEETISSAAGDPGKPSERLYEPANFSYIGISVGISYFF